jgi:cell division protein WhiA
MDHGSFTEAVRQELSRTPIEGDAPPRAELSGIVRLAGSIAVRGGDDRGLRLEVATTSGAVARRTFGLLQHRYGVRPELLVRAPGGVRRRTVYGVHVGASARRIAEDLQVVDSSGRPLDELPAGLEGKVRLAYLRGAVLASATVSHPARAPHLEIAVASDRVAGELAELVRGVVGGTVSVVEGPRRRVVIKSGERIGELLAALGATRAFLDWDDRRLRRQLRGEANRLANADGANLRRTIEASADQVRAVETTITALGWDRLDEELRVVALARLANPEASLAELGELVDPPVGKSAVHRRLRRLALLAARAEAGATPSDGEPEGP